MVELKIGSEECTLSAAMCAVMVRRVKGKTDESSAALAQRPFKSGDGARHRRNSKREKCQRIAATKALGGFGNAENSPD
jgi:hypothetical protein